MIAYTHYSNDGRVRLEAESLASWGYDVFFLVPKKGQKPVTYKLSGVTVKELSIQQYSGTSKLLYILSYLAFLGLAFVACTRFYIQSGMDIVHVHNMPNILIFAALVPRLCGCKLILDIHDTILETYVAKFGITSRLLISLFRWEESVSCSLAHRLIAVNHVQRDALIKRGISPSKIATVITMPGFTSHQHASNNHKKDHTFRMVNHGTMSQRLGNDLIVKAAATLIHVIPNFELHVIGGGDGLDEMIRLTESLGLKDHVHFRRGVPWEQLPETLAMMDVGIVSNRINIATELMLPSKLIDYVSLDIPAIAPRLKTIEYYFSPDLVTFFEPENVDSMVEATVGLFRDKDRRTRQAQIARSFLAKYAWDNPQNGLRELYDNLYQDKIS